MALTTLATPWQARRVCQDAKIWVGLRGGGKDRWQQAKGGERQPGQFVDDREAKVHSNEAHRAPRDVQDFRHERPALARWRDVCRLYCNRAPAAPMAMPVSAGASAGATAI